MWQEINQNAHFLSSMHLRVELAKILVLPFENLLFYGNVNGDHLNRSTI